MSTTPTENIGVYLSQLTAQVRERSPAAPGFEAGAIDSIERAGALVAVEGFDGHALHALANIAEWFAGNRLASTPAIEAALERVSAQAITQVHGHKMLSITTPGYWGKWEALHGVTLSAAFMRYVSGSASLMKTANNLSAAVGHLKPARPPHQPRRELVIGAC